MDTTTVAPVFVDGARALRVHEHVEEHGFVVLTLAGELDGSCEALEAALARTWASWPVAVTIDLRQVTFLNARGLASLLRAARKARARRVRLTMPCGPGTVARLLVMVGLC